MMWWGQVQTWIELYSSEIILAVALVSVFFFIAAVLFLASASLLRKKYRKLMMQRDGLNLEELLNHYGDLITANREQGKQLELRLVNVEKQLVNTIAGVSLIRFNAFQETGSDLSFSLALLDRQQNGVIVTSIFGREESRCYGKPVKNGVSPYSLSAEEIKALDEAKKMIGC